jgi:hypothetical protein
VYILILAASVEASNIFHRPNVALINLRGGAGPDDIPSFDIPSVDPTNIVSESVDMVESVSTTDFETNGAPDLESVSSLGAEKKNDEP